MTTFPRARLRGTATPTALAAILALAALIALAPLDVLVAAALLVGAAAVLVLPELGLVIAALGVPFAGLATLASGAGSITLTPVVLALAATGWLAAVLLGLRRPAFDKRLVAALAVLLLAQSLASWRAPSPIHAGFEMARWLELGLALVLASASCTRPRSRALVLAALLAAGTAAGAVGIYLALERVGPESYAILGGRLYRAYGTFGQPNPFGAYMNMVWPIGAGLVAVHALRLVPPLASGEPPEWSSNRAIALAWALVGALTAAVAGLALVLSWSRGAWLAAAGGGLAMAGVYVVGTFGRRFDARRLLVSTIGLATVLALLLGGLWDQVPGSVSGRLGSIVETFVVWDVADAEVSDDNFATVERVAHWQAAAAMWADRPWLGQGPGHFELVYDRYRLPRWSESLGHAHNYYLHALAESGIVGLAAYLVFLGAALFAATLSALRPRTPMQGALALGLVGVLTTVAIHSLTDNVFVHETTVHLGLLLGLAYAAGGNVRLDSATRISR